LDNKKEQTSIQKGTEEPSWRWQMWNLKSQKPEKE